MVDWSSHPVDVLADLWPEADLELLAEMRAYCDQPVTLTTAEQAKWFADLHARSIAYVSYVFDAEQFPDTEAGEEDGNPPGS